MLRTWSRLSISSTFSILFVSLFQFPLLFKLVIKLFCIHLASIRIPSTLWQEWYVYYIYRFQETYFGTKLWEKKNKPLIVLPYAVILNLISFSIFKQFLIVTSNIILVAVLCYLVRRNISMKPGSHLILIQF
jgi:hypothetical protein